MWKNPFNRRSPLDTGFNMAFDEGWRLTDEAMQELGQEALINEVTVGNDVMPLLPTEKPLVQRPMHGAELRPFLLNTWQKVRQDERDSSNKETMATSQRVIEMVAYLAGHLSSRDADYHLSVSDLMSTLDFDEQTMESIEIAHMVANPENTGDGTV